MVKLILFLLLLSLASVAQTAPAVTLLKEEQGGEIYHFLVSTPHERPDIENAAQQAINEYCKDGSDCRMIYFWGSHYSFSGLMYKRDTLSRVKFYNNDPEEQDLATEDFKRRHWAGICEGLLAVYDRPDSTISFLPYLDAEYYQYGGKLNRPGIKTIKMVLVEPQKKPDTVAGPTENSPFFYLNVLAIIGAGWWAYRRRKKSNQNLTR